MIISSGPKMTGATSQPGGSVRQYLAATVGLSFRISTDMPLALLFLALASTCFVFNPLQGKLFHSDAAVPVLVSTVKWSVFYWEEDRFGMVLQLLASFVHDPLWNYFLQNIMSAMLSLSSFFFLARFVFGPRYFFLAGLIGSTAFLGLYSNFKAYEYLGIAQCYGTSAGFGYCGALLLQSRPRSLALRLLSILSGALSIFSSILVGPVFFFSFVPLLFFRKLLALPHYWGLEAPPESDSPPSACTYGRLLKLDSDVWLLAICILSLLGYVALMLTSQYHVPGRYSFIEFAKIPEKIIFLLGSFREEIFPDWPVSTLLACLGVTSCATLFRSQNHVLRQLAWRSAAALAAAIFCDTMTILLNTYTGSARHMYFSQIMFLVLLAGTTSLAAATFMRSTLRPLNVVTFLACCALVLALYGFPSYRATRLAFEERFKPIADEIIQANCTHFLGSYWNTWTTVFYTNHRLNELGRQDKLWGLGQRSDNTRELWQAVNSNSRFCSDRSEKVDWLLDFYGIAATNTTTINKITVRHY